VRRGALLALCACIALGLPHRACSEVEGVPPPWDPVEQVNRNVFFVNDSLDRYAVEQVARGWELITHEQMRLAIDRFFTNLSFLVRVFGTLGQGRPLHAGEELLRFSVNTTVGVAGFFDPATQFGLDFHDEDFGQALAAWRIPQGPYLVLPVPILQSTGRDAFAYLIDTALNPVTYMPGVGALRLLNARALALDDVRVARQASLDFYGFARSAYLERRWQQIHDISEDEGTSDDLYELEDDPEPVDPPR
jgi:phospholipid-binding lipoprotein MlaA